jgi:murein DD-endopeptidase MepM/ murein hydrolase activator NlpD
VEAESLPSTFDLASASPDGHAKLDASPSSHRKSDPAPVEAGDASVAETLAGLARAARPEAVALAPAPEVAPSAKLRPFFAPPPLEADTLIVLPAPKLARLPQEFILPFERGRVTSMFNQGRRHPAIDLAGPLGTSVYATTIKQRVTFAGWRGGYGNLVITRDPQGRQHYYGHLHRIIARVGALLEQGETLGLLGTTGRSTGPHVHYEVRTSKGRHLDPSKLLFVGLRVGRGYAWTTKRPDLASTRLADRTGQPRPR